MLILPALQFQPLFLPLHWAKLGPHNFYNSNDGYCAYFRRNYAKANCKGTCGKYAVVIAPVIKFFIVIFSPLSLFFRGWTKLLNKVFGLGKVSTVTEEELKTYVSEAHTGGEIDDNESKLIRSSIEFDDIDVCDILTPRVDVDAVDKYASFDEIEKLFKSSNHSRLPVYINDIDNIVGLIHHRDFEEARTET